MERLTKQEKEFVKGVVETGNQTQSVIKAFPKIKSKKYARVKGTRLITKDNIQQAIKTIADQIPDELIVRKHLELLNKKEKVTKNNMTTGEIDVINTGEIDTQAVKSGLDMAYKIKGTYAPEKLKIEPNDVFETDAEDDALLNEYEEKIRANIHKRIKKISKEKTG
mgnify:CR=1 FL=1